MKYKPANVRVAHVRFPAEDGTIDNRGGATVAAEVNENHQVVKYAVAYCHRNDNFNKSLGWNKAVGRVISKDKFKTPDNPIEWRELVNLFRGAAEIGVSYNGTV